MKGKWDAAGIGVSQKEIKKNTFPVYYETFLKQAHILKNTRSNTTKSLRSDFLALLRFYKLISLPGIVPPPLLSEYYKAFLSIHLLMSGI